MDILWKPMNILLKPKYPLNPMNYSMDLQKHLHNTYLARARIDTKKPMKPQFLVKRQRQKRMKEDMKNRIYKHNQILLNKMIEIEKKEGPLNPESLRKRHFTKDSMNFEYRKRQMY